MCTSKCITAQLDNTASMSLCLHLKLCRRMSVSLSAPCATMSLWTKNCGNEVTNCDPLRITSTPIAFHDFLSNPPCLTNGRQNPYPMACPHPHGLPCKTFACRTNQSCVLWQIFPIAQNRTNCFKCRTRMMDRTARPCLITLTCLSVNISMLRKRPQ